MRTTRSVRSLLLLTVVLPIAAVGQADYKTPEQLVSSLHDIAGSTRSATLHQLGETPGGLPLAILEIGDQGVDAPGILLIANMSGDAPAASEAALELAEKLSKEWSDVTRDRTWYIYPCGNPDGYSSFFDTPQAEAFRNVKPFNDDVDLQTDEDGPDDLNGDGLITMIRQLHPEGTWIEVEGQPYMEIAKPGKGENGRYRLFPEGLDDDGDGQINEDGAGGVNPGNNFPHRFQLHSTYAGLWPASETESRELMQFAFAHPNIAMVLVFGRSNTLLNVPETSRSPDLLDQSFSVPGWLAHRTGLKRGKRMKLGELLPIARDAMERPNLTAEKMVSWLSDDAETEPHPSDLPYWNEIADRYKTFLDSSGVNTERIDPPQPVDGSVEEWAYYQYGTPTFALDFWTVPMPSMADDDSTAEKPRGERRKKMENRGQDEGNSEREALLAYRPDAWLEWTPNDHPSLGSVEIGGVKPFMNLAPDYNEIQDLLDAQLPFVLELSEMLPQIAIDSVSVQERATGVYVVDAWVSNRGFLPYPTHHGHRTQRPVPVAALIEGVEVDDLLEGHQRTVLGLLEGSGGTEKVRWVVAAKSGSKITIKVWSRSAGSGERVVTMRGGQR